MEPSSAVTRAIAGAVENRHNAFVTVHTDAAPRTHRGPLAGVPIAVKDIIDEADKPNTAGSAFFTRTPSVSSPAVARLEQSGAVAIGRTGLHEFAFGFNSENPWTGPVFNPWDHRLSAGGSSGGSAAAVAAGTVPIALGTDTGGSVRVPAALCGVAGLKTTWGLIPLDGVFGLVPSLDTVGAIAWHLDDLAESTRLMANDPDRHRWNRKTDAADIRLLVPDRWVETAPLSDRVGHEFSVFVENAADCGIRLEHDIAAELGPSPHNTALIAPEVAAIHSRWRAEGRPYGDDVGERVDRAIGTSEHEHHAALAWKDTLTAAMLAATEDGVIVVTPTTAALDKVIGDDAIGDHHHRTVLSWFTAPVNVTGCPALSVPLPGAGRTSSLHLIGPPGSEPRLLAAARTLQDLGLLTHPRPVATGED